MDILGITDTVEEEFEYFKERTMHGTCQWLLGRQYFREWAASTISFKGVGNQHKRTVSYFLRSITFQVALAYDSFLHTPSGVV